MPALSAEQRDALREDIAENGVLVPITVDQHGRILDGHNRSEIATELGIECPRIVQRVEDDNAAMDLAVMLNCARRHLTRVQVQELIAAELDRRPEDSDRAVARRVGCDHKTVGAVRRGRTGEVPQGTATSIAKAEKVTVGINEQLGLLAQNFDALIIDCLCNKVTAMELIGALTISMKRWADAEGANDLVVDLFRRSLVEPRIAWLSNPENVDRWRDQWDHDEFVPLTDQERHNVLDRIASGWCA